MAGVVGLGKNISGLPTYYFCYQATDSFSIAVNYSFENSPTDASATLTYQEIGGSPVSSTTSISAASGIAGFSLPPSTFCKVTLAVVGSGGELTTSLS